MQTISFGLIAVPSPGTPVPISSDPNLRVMQMMVRTVPGFTGKTYLGVAGMNKNAPGLPGVIRILSEPPMFGPQDGEVLPPGTGGRGNLLQVANYCVDADVPNEGVTVTCFVA